MLQWIGGSDLMGGMARKARVEFAGAVYHVLDRGDRREPIFRDDADREAFVAALGQACQRTGWWVPAQRLHLGHVSQASRAATAALSHELKTLLSE